MATLSFIENGSHQDNEVAFPTIIHLNRETFEFKGQTYLSQPTLSEFLVEAGIANIRVFKSVLKELYSQGIQSIDDLVNVNKSRLLQLESITKETANHIFRFLMLVKHRGPFLLSGQDLEHLDKDYFYLEFVKEIDEVLLRHLNGKFGLRSKSIIELCGSDGVGKTQWCITAACSMLRVGKRVVYIDSEDGFDYHRISQIAKSSRLANRSIRDNVILSRIDSFDELDLVLDELSAKIREHNIGMIIIDSLMQLLQTSYPVDRDMANLAERQLHLRKTMRRLRVFARLHNLIILYTNRTRERRYTVPMNITDDIPENEEDLRTLTKLLKRLVMIELPMGGPTLALSSDIRIYMGPDSDDQSKLLAIVENCSYLPRLSVNYEITEQGIKAYVVGPVELPKKHVDDFNDLLS